MSTSNHPVEDKRLEALHFIEKNIVRTKILEAALFWIIKKEELYLAVEGCKSFKDYAESARCRINYRRAMDYVEIFKRFGPFLPEITFNYNLLQNLQLESKNGTSEVSEGVDVPDLRNTIDIKPQNEKETSAWEITRNTPVTSLSELAKNKDINLEPIQYGAGIEMPDGSILMTRELPNMAVKEVRKKLKPKPKVNISPDAIRTEQRDPEQELDGIIKNASRMATHLRSEIGRLKTTDLLYNKYEKEIRAVFYQVKQIHEYGQNEKNFIKTSAEEAVVQKNMVQATKVADALSVNIRRVQQMAKDLPPDCVEMVSGPSGKTLYIVPEALPEEHALEWKKYKAPDEIMSREERDALVWSQATESQREHAAPYLELIKLTKGLKGKALEAAINKYNAEHPDQDDVTTTSFYRNKADYKKDGLEGIIPDWGKNAGKSKVHPDDVEYFGSLYITQNKLSADYCYEQTLAKASRDGRILVENKDYWEIDLKTGDVFQKYPVASTILSAVIKRFTKEAVEYGREGEYKFKQTGASYHVDRDLTNHNAGDIWVSDHRQIDVLCISDERQIYQAAKKVLHAKLTEENRSELKKKVRNLLAANIKNNKPFRPWLTAWIDMKTNKWISWSLHSDAPNSGHIKQTLKWGIEQYGAPKYIYVDNGKDYRAKSFAGNRTHYKLEFDENEIKPLCYQLGIIPKFAKPYNARAKTIERQFRLLIEKYEKTCTTYTGKNTANRPAVTDKNVKKGIIPDFNDIVSDFDKLFELINREPREGKELMGMSPDQLWSKSWKLRRPLSANALKMFCMEFSKPKQLVANGYKDPHLKRFYYADWMAGMYKRRVILIRDPEKWQEAWVLDAETKEILGHSPAKLIGGTDGMAETPEAQEKVSRQNEIQAQRKNILKAQLKDLKKVSNGEALENYAEIVNLKEQISDFTYDEPGSSVIPMPNRDTQLDDLADQISQTKLARHRKETTDLSKITPAAPAKKESFKNPLDDVDVSDLIDDNED